MINLPTKTRRGILYTLDKFAPNDEFILVRNPDYWRGWSDANKFEKIIIKVLPENSTRRQLLEKGDADISYLTRRKTCSRLSNPATSTSARPT